MSSTTQEPYGGTSHDLALDLLTALIEDQSFSNAEREMVEMALDGDWSWVENEFEPDGRAYPHPLPEDPAERLLFAIGIFDPNAEELDITHAALQGDGNPACARFQEEEGNDVPVS